MFIYFVIGFIVILTCFVIFGENIFKNFFKDDDSNNFIGRFYTIIVYIVVGLFWPLPTAVITAVLLSRKIRKELNI